VFVGKGVLASIPLAKRPEGGKLLTTLKSGDVVISPRLDRCFRSALDALSVLNDLKEQKVSLHLLDMGGDVLASGHARMLFTILSAVSEAERERVRERVLDVKRDQASRSRFLGGSIPFGYKLEQEAKGAKLVEIPEQQNAIKEMLRLKNDGRSLRDISEAMKERGFQISHVAVGRTLKRRKLLLKGVW
jgi:putative DNA-invertase from lambdoid prophage Rac